MDVNIIYIFNQNANIKGYLNIGFLIENVFISHYKIWRLYFPNVLREAPRTSPHPVGYPRGSGVAKAKTFIILLFLLNLTILIQYMLYFKTDVYILTEIYTGCPKSSPPLP